MNKSKTLRLCLTYAGCFLGAGYISGQELWQYFGAFGGWGFAGLALAMILLAGFGVLLLFLLQRTGITEMDAIVVRFRLPWLRTAVGILEALFLFGIVITMAAGVGALFQQLLGISPKLSCLFFCIIVAVVCLTGARGMVNVFSVTVPLLILFSIVIGCLAFCRAGAAVTLADTHSNPLLGSWWFSAVTFVSYNLLGSIGVITAASKLLDKRRGTILRGILLSCLLMALTAVSILLGMLSTAGATEVQLPVLAVAAELHPVCGYIAAALLLCGMFSTGLSCLVASAEYCKQRVRFFDRHRVVLAVLLGALAYGLSMLGYDNIIGSIFPFFGYLGIVALLLMVEHFLHVTRHKSEAK